MRIISEWEWGIIYSLDWHHLEWEFGGGGLRVRQIAKADWFFWGCFFQLRPSLFSSLGMGHGRWVLLLGLAPRTPPPGPGIQLSISVSESLSLFDHLFTWKPFTVTLG